MTLQDLGSLTVSDIPELQRADLVKGWELAHGKPPPKGLGRRLLEHAVAWKLQERQHGGLSAGTRRKLASLAARSPSKGSAKQPSARARSLAPGSRLMRDWGGRTFTVDVLEKGFLLDGQHYGSLSEIARAITGARWSGPRFFGL